jgi:hypothetical protein
MKIVICVIIILVLILPAILALECTISNSACASGNTLLYKMSSLDNAHAEYFNQSNYANNVCCSVPQDTLSNTCGASILWMSSLTNAHVTTLNNTYPIPVCLSAATGSISCQYTNTTNCTAPYTCAGSISSLDNAHVGNCSAYDYKVCCKYTSDIPSVDYIFLNSSSIYNTSLDNYTLISNFTGPGIIYNTTWFSTPYKNPIFVMDFDVNTTAPLELSGWGTKGTLVNSNTIWINGSIKDGAYYFNGLSGMINTTPSVNYNLTGNLTISVWVNISKKLNWSRIISKSTSTAVYPYTMYGLLTDNTSKFRMELASNGRQYVVTSNTTYSNNTWYYVTGVYDSSINQARLYINGVLESSTLQENTTVNVPGLPGNIDTNNVPITIGNSYFMQNPINGTIDEPRIYNYVLSDFQIALESQKRYDIFATPLPEGGLLTGWAIANNARNYSSLASATAYINPDPFIVTHAILPPVLNITTRLNCVVIAVTPYSNNISLEYSIYRADDYTNLTLIESGSTLVANNTQKTIYNISANNLTELANEYWTCQVRVKDSNLTAWSPFYSTTKKVTPISKGGTVFMLGGGGAAEVVTAFYYNLTGVNITQIVFNPQNALNRLMAQRWLLYIVCTVVILLAILIIYIVFKDKKGDKNEVRKV